jgi:hypothetical protein
MNSKHKSNCQFEEHSKVFILTFGPNKLDIWDSPPRIATREAKLREETSPKRNCDRSWLASFGKVESRSNLDQNQGATPIMAVGQRQKDQEEEEEEETRPSTIALLKKEKTLEMC